jgi:hypothetical protein
MKHVPQVTGVPTHWPFWQLSPLVQALLSLQGAPLAAALPVTQLPEPSQVGALRHDVAVPHEAPEETGDQLIVEVDGLQTKHLFAALIAPVA